jgi:hypothetical protein
MGMIFRLRHLNTGRLVVMQEIDQEGLKSSKNHQTEKIKTIGLSDHLAKHVTVSVSKKKNGHQQVNMECNQPQKEHQLAATS